MSLEILWPPVEFVNRRTERPCKVVSIIDEDRYIVINHDGTGTQWDRRIFVREHWRHFG